MNTIWSLDLVVKNKYNHAWKLFNTKELALEHVKLAYSNFNIITPDRFMLDKDTWIRIEPVTVYDTIIIEEL